MGARGRLGALAAVPRKAPLRETGRAAPVLPVAALLAPPLRAPREKGRRASALEEGLPVPAPTERGLLPKTMPRDAGRPATAAAFLGLKPLPKPPGLPSFTFTGLQGTSQRLVGLVSLGASTPRPAFRSALFWPPELAIIGASVAIWPAHSSNAPPSEMVHRGPPKLSPSGNAVP